MRGLDAKQSALLTRRRRRGFPVGRATVDEDRTWEAAAGSPRSSSRSRRPSTCPPPSLLLAPRHPDPPAHRGDDGRGQKGHRLGVRRRTTRSREHAHVPARVAHVLGLADMARPAPPGAGTSPRRCLADGHRLDPRARRERRREARSGSSTGPDGRDEPSALRRLVPHRSGSRRSAPPRSSRARRARIPDLAPRKRNRLARRSSKRPALGRLAARHRRLDPRPAPHPARQAAAADRHAAGSTSSAAATSPTSSRSCTRQASRARRSARRSAPARWCSTTPACTPNPARDRSIKLPREEPEEINPPSAEHVEAVYRLIPSKHRLRCSGSTGPAPASPAST